MLFTPLETYFYSTSAQVCRMKINVELAQKLRKLNNIHVFVASLLLSAFNHVQNYLVSIKQSYMLGDISSSDSLLM